MQNNMKASGNGMIGIQWAPFDAPGGGDLRTIVPVCAGDSAETIGANILRAMAKEEGRDKSGDAAYEAETERMMDRILQKRRELFCSHRGTVEAYPGGSRCSQCGTMFNNFTPYDM